MKFVFSYSKLENNLLCWNFQNPRGLGKPMSNSSPSVWNESLKQLHLLPSWILYPSARENKKSKSTLLQKTALDALFPQHSQELAIWSKTSHKSKNHTEVYLAICLLLLMLKLNKIRCFIVKPTFCLLIFVPKWRLRGDISIVLWWCATTFCWKRQVGHSIKKVGNHCFNLSSARRCGNALPHHYTPRYNNFSA